MAVLDAGAERLEPNGEGGFAVCVLCVFLQSIGLPVFPTGAIVVVCMERENMISLDPGLPLGWEGITDPCFTKYSLRVCSSVLHTIARCPPGCMASCTNNIVCFVSLMHWWLGPLAVGDSVAVMLAFTAPILMLHTHSYKTGWPFCGSDYI
jgi:hypothetical protein